MTGFSVHLEWGPVGADAAAPGDLAVVVDVLSFTTTLSVAADRGVDVVPCPWRPSDRIRQDRAAALARHHGAVLAVRRAEAGPGDVSLSPASLRAAEALTRVVLPSPNAPRSAPCWPSEASGWSARACATVARSRGG